MRANGKIKLFQWLIQNVIGAKLPGYTSLTIFKPICIACTMTVAVTSIIYLINLESNLCTVGTSSSILMVHSVCSV